MNYALERVAAELASDMKRYNIEADPKRNLLIADNVVTRLVNTTFESTYRRIIGAAIKDAKDKRVVRLQAKQTSLLQSE